MARHDPSSMSEDQLVASGPAEAEVRAESLREQLKTSERLNEYYIQVVAELRASLDEIEARDRAAS